MVWADVQGSDDGDADRMTIVEPEPHRVEPEPGLTEPLLECGGICKRFGAVEALVDVDFEVYPARSSHWSATTAPASRR